MHVPSLVKIPWHLFKLGNENIFVSRADNSDKIWRNLPISCPKPDLHNINAHTKFGEFYWCLLKVSSGKKIQMDGRMYDRRMSSQLDTFGYISIEKKCKSNQQEKKKKKPTRSPHFYHINGYLIVLGFYHMSTLVGHFVSSRREREKRDSRDEREGQGRKRKMNESKDTDEIKHSPSTHTCPTVSKYKLDALVTQDTRHLCLTQTSPSY